MSMRRTHHGLMSAPAVVPLCVINDPPPLAVTSSVQNGLPVVRTMAMQFTTQSDITNASPISCMASFGVGAGAFIWLFVGESTGGATGETVTFFKTDASSTTGNASITTAVPAGTHTLVMASDTTHEAAWLDGVSIPAIMVGATRTDYTNPLIPLTVGARALDGSANPGTDFLTDIQMHRVVAGQAFWTQADVDNFIAGGTPANSFDPGCPVT